MTYRVFTLVCGQIHSRFPRAVGNIIKYMFTREWVVTVVQAPRGLNVS